MKIVITGGAGFIGYHLAKELVNQGHSVTVYDNLSGPGAERIFELEGVSVADADLADVKELYETCRLSDTIYHLAAQIIVQKSMIDPREDMLTNLAGTVNVLEVARKTGARVILASSGAVYGIPRRNPVSESDSTKPISFYGLSKKAAEDYCKMYHKQFGMECVIARIFNCYGPHCHGVVRDVIERLSRSPGAITLLGRPGWTKDFVYVYDVVRALSGMLELGSLFEPHIFNIGSGEATKLETLAREICQQMGSNPVIDFTGSSWPGDVTSMCADTARLHTQLDWTPETSLSQGIAETLEWFHSGRVAKVELART